MKRHIRLLILLLFLPGIFIGWTSADLANVERSQKNAAVSSKVTQGYLQLMNLLTNPTYHKTLAPFIKKLKISKVKDPFPFYSITSFADDHDIPFIMLLDWKSEITNLDWRISTAAKKNFNTAVALPGAKHWGADRSISYTGVLPAYQKALKKSGLQMAFIDTESDEYALIVFKTGQQKMVKAAVELTGFKYYEE